MYVETRLDVFRLLFYFSLPSLPITTRFEALCDLNITIHNRPSKDDKINATFQTARTNVYSHPRPESIRIQDTTVESATLVCLIYIYIYI